MAQGGLTYNQMIEMGLILVEHDGWDRVIADIKNLNEENQKLRDALYKVTVLNFNSLSDRSEMLRIAQEALDIRDATEK